MFDTYDLAPSRVSVAGMLAREFGIEVLSSPPLCSAYVYVMADIDLFASGHRAWLYIGSRGKVTGALFDPMADVYTGSGAAWTETHSGNLLKFIVSTFADRDGAYAAEEALLLRIDAARHPEFFNDKNAGRGADGSLMSRPDVRARHAAAVTSPEYRALQSRIQNDPSVKARKRATRAVTDALPETKARRSAATTKLMQDPAIRQNLSDRRKEFYRDPVRRAENAATQKRVHGTPERRAAKSALQKMLQGTPEARAANATRQAVAQNRPEVIAKKRAAALARLGCPEARDAISLATKEAMARPEIVEKIARHRSTPEYKAAYSAKHKARWADPEAAARNRAAIRAGWADPVKRAARLEKRAATRAAKLKGDTK